MASPKTPARHWLRAFHAAPDARTTLICLPHAGGPASFYYQLSRLLAPRVEVLCAQYPGRQDRLAEPPARTLADLLDAIVGELPDLDDRHLALFGHSMGATVAFELALRLEHQSGRAAGPSGATAAPAVVFVSNRRAPSLPTTSLIHTYADERLAAVLSRLGGTEDAVLADRELLRGVLPAVRADYRIIETYGPSSERLRCPIVALRGQDDPVTSHDQATAWREHTAGPFELLTFPGGHFYAAHWDPGLVRAIEARLPGRAGEPERAGIGGARDSGPAHARPR